jgi:GT2 family glycosyltransferase
VRILVHVTCCNAANIIGATLDAILQQTLALEEILIVDNASTDGTPELAYPAIVTVVRNPLNLGPGGAVATGLEYARAQGYDWLWVLDDDSRPLPDALESLTRLVESGDPSIGIVATSHNLINLGWILRGRMLTAGGPRLPTLRQDRNFIDCDTVIWSGALINLAVVERVGLPRVGTLGVWDDLSFDYGDIEYTYRIRRAGYKILVHRDTVMDHRVGMGRHARIFGWNVYSTNHTAFRRYLYFRNLVFFWLKIYHRRNWPLLLLWFSYRMSTILAGIILLESERGTKIKACLLGIRDGLRGRLDGRFETSP